jgi:hypothetical protein
VLTSRACVPQLEITRCLKERVTFTNVLSRYKCTAVLKGLDAVNTTSTLTAANPFGPRRDVETHAQLLLQIGYVSTSITYLSPMEIFILANALSL